MRRGGVLLALVLLVTSVASVACGGERAPSGGGSTTSAAAPSTSVPADGGTTTTAGGTQAAGQIPWPEVGAGWFLVLYDHTVEATGPAPGPEGPRELLLVSPEGRRFPVGRWGSELAGVSDWSPDGRRALVRRWAAGAGGPAFTELDLRTGVETAVDAAGPPVDAGYTRPEGANLVLTLRGPGDGYRLVRTDRRGRLLATLADQASSDPPRWLYLPDGTGAVVGAGTGLVVVRNDGTPARPIDVPRGNCAPVRWWEPGVALASCRGDAAEDNYSQLWRVPVGGGLPVALTALPAAHDVVDFGITDARAVGGRTILQWQGDCGAAALKVLSAGGGVADLPVDGEQEVVLVDAVGGRLAVWGRAGCDGPGLWLGWVDPQGGRREVLVEAAVTPAGEERGIQGVIAFGGGRGT